MKLILKHYSTDGCTYHCEYPIAFEYESKEKFVLDVLEKHTPFKQNEWGNAVVEILGYRFDQGDIEGIEHNVFTLDEWFDKEKEIMIL